MILSVKNGENTIQVPTIEHANLLMDIAEHLNCVIQKYYWQSRFSEYTEDIEPKIIDAFSVIVILKGDNDMLGEVNRIYQEKSKVFDKLPIEPKLTETEIKALAVMYCAKR